MRNKWEPWFSLVKGRSRSVILIGDLCLKFPTLRNGLLGVFRGLYSNYYEGTWFKWANRKESMVPKLFNHGCFGFMLAEERCEMKKHFSVTFDDDSEDRWGYSFLKRHEVLVSFYDRTNSGERYL
jgi:hypothetical protein